MFCIYFFVTVSSFIIDLRVAWGGGGGVNAEVINWKLLLIPDATTPVSHFHLVHFPN